MPKLSKEKRQAIRELLRSQGGSDKMAEKILRAAQAGTEHSGVSATRAMQQQLLEELRQQKRKGIKFGKADILEFLGQDEDTLPPEFEQLVDEFEEGHEGMPMRRPRVPLPPVREIVIPEQTTVAELAVLLDETKYRILADLLRVGVDLNTNQTPDYETITKVARMHGYIAKRAL